jgi:gamma-D-glutamyl-L-lysine dipeptidyl-peptidase
VGVVSRSVLRATGVALVAVLSVAGCAGARTTSAGPGTPSGASATSVPREPGSSVGRTTPPPLVVGHDAWVSVSVATVWRAPDSPRPVDAPALTHPVRVETWLAGMSLAERRGLSGRADTQVLLGDRVRVLALPANRPAWARVAVPSQPSPADARGYPGWVPRRQLTALPQVASSRRATVVTRTAWLRTDSSPATRLFRISFGTSLAVVGETDGFVRVATPSGTVRRLASSAVVVHAAGQPARTPSRASLVRTAEQFRGLPYLWAGVSGFGLDCSGLTWLDYRVHGIRIPRDALPQSQHGRQTAAPRRGDLMFYATDGLVHHVSMYAGNGQMVHSPHTGSVVQVIPVSTPAYLSEYVGSRRYLP